MKVLENPTRVELAEILDESDDSPKRILFVLDESTSASRAVAGIFSAIEKYDDPNIVVVTNDQLFVKLLMVQFDHQLKNHKKSKMISSVLSRISVVTMKLNLDLSLFAKSLDPYMIVINTRNQIDLESRHVAERVVLGYYE